MLDERIERARGLQDRACGIAVLNIGAVRFDEERAPVGIDKRMAFAAVDLLAGVVSTRTAALGRLDALAVDDRRRRRRFAPAENSCRRPLPARAG